MLHRDGCPVGIRNGKSFPRDLEHALPVIPGGDFGAFQFAVPPCDVHVVAAPGAQAAYFAFRPCAWQSRQQVNFFMVTLQEHFDDGRGAPEGAVDLEYVRRVKIQE